MHISEICMLPDLQISTCTYTYIYLYILLIFIVCKIFDFNCGIELFIYYIKDVIITVIIYGYFNYYKEAFLTVINYLRM